MGHETRPGNVEAILAAALLVGALVGCGSEDVVPSDDEEEPPPPAVCERPNRLVEDRCIEPGMQDDGCLAGTVLQPDGSCAPAGVTPPPACETGLTAAVGADTCTPVMACGAGTWGDLPVDGATQYVDESFAGISDGTEAAPWTTIAAGVAAAPPGGLVAVAAGTYDETVTISGKPVRLWGVCPDAVTVNGGNPATIFMTGGADGTEVGGITVTGSSIGVGASGALDVVVDRVRVQGTADRGVNVEASFGETSITIRDSLIEDAVEFGVFLSASAMTLERVVIRDTRPEGVAMGRGINAKNAGVTAAALHVVDSVVERSAEQAIYVASSVATLERVVVRQSGGDGAGFVADIGAAPTVANVVHSVFELNHLTGMYTIASQATLTGVVVTDTQPRQSDLLGGRGLSVETASSVEVKGGVFERNTNIALFVGAATAAIDGVVVRDTAPNAFDALDGRGINIENDIPTGTPSVGTVYGSLLEGNSEISLAVLGSEAQIVSTLVRDTMLQGPTGLGGRGITIQASVSNGVRSTGSVLSSLVENSRDTGILVGGADATLDSIVVRETTGDGGSTFGDGILVVSELGAANVDLRRSLIENSIRAAIGNFSGHVVMQDTTLACQAVDIASETLLNAVEPTLENLGNNACGCPAELDACKAISSGLTPPSPLD